MDIACQAMGECGWRLNKEPWCGGMTMPMSSPGFASLQGDSEHQAGNRLLSAGEFSNQACDLGEVFNLAGAFASSSVKWAH